MQISNYDEALCCIVTLKSTVCFYIVCIWLYLVLKCVFDRCLGNDPDCKSYLPLDPGSGDLYQKTQDGIIYWWVFINMIVIDVFI